MVTMTTATCANREVSFPPSFYGGEQYDSDLGLYYLRARYYNAGTDRFMSRDSEDGVPSDPKTLHKYDYAGGDPVNVMDPSGRSSLVEYSLPTNIVSLGPTKMQRQYDNYTHQYVTTVAPQTILSLDNLACSIKALYAQGSYAAQGISSEADFVGCTAVPEQFAELCVRRFYPGFPVPALHCYVRFNGNKNDTLSFDSQGVHPDPAPSWWPQQYCRRINGGQNNDCLRNEMKKCTPTDFSVVHHNCCDCAEQAIKACGLSLPTGGLPNWPINR